MKDFLEHLEAAGEAEYEARLQPDGRLKCDCGKSFYALEEGGPVSDNPYAMPVCGDCLERELKMTETSTPYCGLCDCLIVEWDIHQISTLHLQNLRNLDLVWKRCKQHHRNSQLVDDESGLLRVFLTAFVLPTGGPECKHSNKRSDNATFLRGQEGREKR